MSSWGFAFTPIPLNLAHSSYRNGEIESFPFGESVSVLVLLST